jgi:hypothetical protein
VSANRILGTSNRIELASTIFVTAVCLPIMTGTPCYTIILAG